MTLDLELFGVRFAVRRTKQAPPGSQPPDGRGGWWPLIREAFTGAWQQNIECPIWSVLSHPVVFACITLIAGDIGKMRWDLVREAGNDVWVPGDNPAFSPFLRKPNHYQTPQQFREHWITSKLESGNTYVLKQRDDRGVVTAGYVLDPWRVRPLVAPDGSVFYDLNVDNLSQQFESRVAVPARDIIHDRFNCLFHPLVGISPLFAAGIPAMLGLAIQQGSARFFGNDSMPSGTLTVPGLVDQKVADDLDARWRANQGGSNKGKVAILGDGMKFEAISQPADKSQLNEQWLSASEAIAVCFHVPFFLVGGPMPPYNNVQTLTVQYQSQCLQTLITGMETTLDAGLGLAPDKINGTQWGVQCNTKDLLLMDTATLSDVIAKQVTAGVLKPNEGRADLNRLPVPGGDTPYLQQQMFSLEALNRRDNEPPPPAPAAAAGPPAAVPPGAVAAALTGFLQRELEGAAA